MRTHQIFKTCEYQQNEDSSDYKTVVRKFNAYFAGHSNEVHERYAFRSRIQTPSNDLSGNLKIQAGVRNFGSHRGSMIRDQVVYGTI